MFRACHSVWLTECFCSHLLLTVLVINIIVVVKMTEGVPMSGSHCQTRHTFSIYRYVMAQTVNNPPAMPETQVRSRCPEDPLEEGMATHSSTLAWEIPWTEEPGGLQPRESQKTQARLSNRAHTPARAGDASLHWSGYLGSKHVCVSESGVGGSRTQRVGVFRFSAECLRQTLTLGTPPLPE